MTVTTTASDPMLKVGEVAAALRISRSSVYLLISSGALKAVKVGELRRVRKSDLDEYIASLEPDPTPSAKYSPPQATGPDRPGVPGPGDSGGGGGSGPGRDTATDPPREAA